MNHGRGYLPRVPLPLLRRRLRLLLFFFFFFFFAAGDGSTELSRAAAPFLLFRRLKNRFYRVQKNFKNSKTEREKVKQAGGGG